MGWRVDFDGHRFREGEMTIEQCQRIEKMVGTNWLRISPLASAEHAAAILTVLYTDKTGADEPTVTKKVGALTIDEFLAAFEANDDDDLPDEYDEGFPPKAAGSSTDT